MGHWKSQWTFFWLVFKSSKAWRAWQLLKATYPTKIYWIRILPFMEDSTKSYDTICYLFTLIKPHFFPTFWVLKVNLALNWGITWCISKIQKSFPKWQKSDSINLYRIWCLLFLKYFLFISSLRSFYFIFVIRFCLFQPFC